MGDNTRIEWCDATWNPITGCSPISPGCTNCYAMRLAGGRLQRHPSRCGLTKPSKTGPVWTGEVRFNAAWQYQPLQWRRPRHIFVCAHGDLFAEGVADEWIDRIFAVMALASQHIFLVLTKRPDRMRRYMTDPAAYRRVLRAAGQIRQWRPRLGRIPISDPCYAAWWPQLWLGVTVEDQKRADARRPDMQALAEAGWQTFASYEPALGPVEWSGWEFLRWLVSGGESGPNARPSHPEWHGAARDFGRHHGIPYHFKHWGAWKPICEMTDDEHSALYRSKRRAKPGEDQAHLDDVFGRRCTVPELCLARDGSQQPVNSPNAWKAGSAPMHAFRVGKASAGRLLNGVEHDTVPVHRGQQYELELQSRPPQTPAPVLEAALANVTNAPNLNVSSQPAVSARADGTDHSSH